MSMNIINSSRVSNNLNILAVNVNENYCQHFDGNVQLLKEKKTLTQYNTVRV